MNTIIGSESNTSVIHIGDEIIRFIYQKNNHIRKNKATNIRTTKRETTTKPLRPVHNIDKHPILTLYFSCSLTFTTIHFILTDDFIYSMFVTNCM